MKMKLCVLIFLLAAALARAQTNNLTALLQQGLFEEQANRNLDAAIADYQSLATQFDKDRQLAATAVFRLGECYRMQGKTNEAALEYQRIVNEFPDQATLATLSRQNLTGLGVAAQTSASTFVSSSATLDNLQGQYVLLKAQLEQARKETNNEIVAELFNDNPELAQKLRMELTMIRPNESMVEEAKARSSAEAIQNAERNLKQAQHEVEAARQQIFDYQEIRLKSLESAIEQGWSVKPKQISSANEATPPAADEDQEIRRIQQMIQNSPDLINRASSDEGTPLFSAASKDQIRVAAFLLDHGADVNAPAGTHGRIWDTWTPLMAAADYGHKAMVDLLLSRGADVNWQNKGGETALYRAVLRGFQAVTEALLANHADVKTRNISGPTPLFSAVQSGQAKIVQMLLAARADANLKDDKGRTVLNYDIGISPEIFQALLEAGTNPNTEDSDGRTPLSYAVERDNPKVVKLLLAAKADPNGGKVDAPLLCAIHKNDTASAELLLQAGAKPNAIGKFDLPRQSGLGGRRGGPFGGGFGGSPQSATPLWLAISENQFPMVQLLLKFKADPNDSQTDGRPLLFGAVSDANILGALLDAGAKVDVMGIDAMRVSSGYIDVGDKRVNYTPLGDAAYQNNAAAVEILLKHGANPNARDPIGNFTPLHWAANNLADGKVFGLLLAYKADPNVRDILGQTPLDILKEKAKFDNHTTSPEQKVLAGELADLLRRQHGALDILPDWDRITVSRPSANFSDVIFRKGTNNWNQFTLFDLLGVQYDLLTASTASLRSGGSRLQVAPYGGSGVENSLTFPDFTRIVIHRPSGGGTNWNGLKINLARALDSGNCAGDVPLQFGDVVEIPEADHVINEPWTGLSTNELFTLKNCLTRHLQITVNGQTTNITVAPQVWELVPGSREYPLSSLRTNMPSAVGLLEFEPFMLWPVLEHSKLLLASSDLSRVTVKRRDGTTGKMHEWTVDCSNPHSPPNFWLRDGDGIEVPEKP